MPAIPIIPQLNITQDAHESASLEIECSVVSRLNVVNVVQYLLGIR